MSFDHFYWTTLEATSTGLRENSVGYFCSVRRDLAILDLRGGEGV